MFRPKPDAEEGKLMAYTNLTIFGVSVVVLKITPYVIYYGSKLIFGDKKA